MIATRPVRPARTTALTLIATAIIGATATAAGTPFSKIVTFGDNLSDTGNAYGLTGGAFPQSPPNAPGRIGNGLLWTEHLAESLGLTLKAENQYAVVGARSDSGNLNVFFGLPMLALTPTPPLFTSLPPKRA